MSLNQQQQNNMVLNQNAATTTTHDGAVKVPPLEIESYKVMDIISQLYNIKDYATIDLIVNSGKVNVNTQNQDGLSLLQLATMESNLVYIQYLLLVKGANVNISDVDQVTPLHLAASLGSLPTIQFLLQCGANVDATDMEGETPAHYSIRESKKDTLALLLKNGASVNSANDDSESLLHLACSLGELDCVKLLVENGANLSALDSSNTLPLQEAKQNGHSDIVDYLKSFGNNNSNNGRNINCFDESNMQYPFNSISDIQYGSSKVGLVSPSNYQYYF